MIALIVVVCSFSCTAFGTLIGAFGLRGRDIFFFANLMIFVFLLFCGVNVPVDCCRSGCRQSPGFFR